MFQTNPRKLSDLLNEAHEGRLQLPDFQRSYVWGDEDVQNLIASVAKGYPIGAFLSLQTGGDVRFKPRLLEGVNGRDTGDPSPAELLLDGQQRLTSLYQTLYSKKPVRTLNSRGKEIDRFYYLNIEGALSAGADLKDAIIGVPADRIQRKNFGREVDIDLSTRDKEFEKHAFPLNHVFNHTLWFPWLESWGGYWLQHGQDLSDWKMKFHAIISQIAGYEIPVIRLDQRNGREAICLIFEKVNTGGKRLDTFELLTAIYASEEFDLREDWSGPLDKSKPGRRERILGSPNRIDVLGGVNSTDFLQACSLLHTREDRLAKEREGVEDRLLPQVSCSRDTLLSLPLEAYKKYADAVESGFGETASFLHEHKIIAQKDVPYAPLLVGLAATFAVLGREGWTVSAEDKTKIERWFWSVTLGEIYGSATDTLLARHVPELVRWIKDTGPPPDILGDATFQQERLRSLRGRYSAAYKAIHVLLMGYEHGCEDFITGKTTGVMTFFNDRIDVHHIFPRAWCRKNGIPESVFNSIVNKTPLSAATNGFIGGDAPSSYLKRIEGRSRLSSEALDAILRTHLIEPEHLRNDDFEAFFAARIEALSGVVSKAMGKPVVKEQGTNEEERDVVVEEPVEDEEGVETVALIDMVRAGESDIVEFKSTLRTNLHTNKPDKKMEFAILRTLAGFLNTNGGTLVVGVSDDGTPVGIEADNFATADKLILHLTNIVNARIGPNAMTLIHAGFDDFEDSRVLVVNCQRSPTEVYVRDDNAQRFYVRTGPSTTELTGSDMVEYVNQRFER